ncbi:MAG TPA: methylmalonyl-CoA mutase family protein [Candidatus Kapabacteria bacterium]|nr:methylmalonyl-CoA mutase family protein [Candidatus Kapabacteria bacterium]
MHNFRVVTAAALFDGHDVSINLFRRLLQKRGAEVIHLGHNRSVNEVVTVALQEDADAILVSSYQGGHNEYFRYIIDLLKEHNAPDILVFGGGGGVILPSEIEALENYGVKRIYHATDGQKIGIDGIADDIMATIKTHYETKAIPEIIYKDTITSNSIDSHFSIAKQLTFLENCQEESILQSLRTIYKNNDKAKSLVIGITGTGGSGKSSVTDEIIGKFISLTKNVNIGVLAVDPSKTTSGGALLGDRIRYNQIYNERVYFRSYATRKSKTELSAGLSDAVDVLKSAGFDIIIVETSGIGQGDSGVVGLVDKSIYVMTSEFGAPSQLEKIDMLDHADYIVINKFDKRGSEDAYREVKINFIRNKSLKINKSVPLDDLELPVFAASANQFNNSGVNRLFKDLLNDLRTLHNGIETKEDLVNILPTKLKMNSGLLNNDKLNYLSDIAETVRNYKTETESQSDIAERCYAIQKTIETVSDKSIIEILEKEYELSYSKLKHEVRGFLENWDTIKHNYQQDEIKYKIQSKELSINLYTKSLSGSKIPKVALPNFKNWGYLSKYFYLENLPGEFPYTAGVFPFKRTTEDPKRQFAGEGSPERTNKRFHYLCANDKAKRLSVAFDGITLYAEDPAKQPDIYGKIGEAGVSICNVDDMDKLLAGFDQVDPLTSVSMTINAPAPIMVAFYFSTAYHRELKKLENEGKHLSNEEKAQFKIDTFRRLRGTVQADMLKEDQAQNTIIFSIDFAMKMIGDLQEFLSKYKIHNYYSLSISGYHIAEAGANPITQLAFTLANGFTYVEYFLNRGLKVDDFAPNLSFFFSNGMDPEYSVIGRVARRIWAVAMKNKYGANDKSQRLKYHIQTSGRSLHAQEIDFNDIRTTLQGLLAFYDNCNSLHTNSYDEAVTTPTEESVRRSMAIQLILTKEFGMLKNENPNQGSFIIEELTELVEEAVLEEFSRLSRRGGVMGAMETQYQRSKIQEESMYYEYLKQNGEYPIIGVNTFINEHPENLYDKMEITRTSDEEKQKRLDEVNSFKSRNIDKVEDALHQLRNVALSGGNIFEELLNTVEYATMGQITKVLYEVGGKYRRGM